MRFTKEKYHEIALCFENSSDFKSGNKNAYWAAQRNGWLKDITTHFVPKINPNGYWTKDRCHEVALNHKTRVDFQKKDRRAYSRAWHNGWLDEICSHMSLQRESNGYWTKSKCHEVALQVTSRVSFSRLSPTAYAKAHKKGWLNEICSHMVPLGHKNARYVYEIWSVDCKSVYVGITLSPEKRLRNHRVRGPCKEMLEQGSVMKLVTGLIPSHEAQKEEHRRVIFHKANGFEIKNRGKTGGLGYCK